jgi:hypothetical protein
MRHPETDEVEAVIKIDPKTFDIIGKYSMTDCCEKTLEFRKVGIDIYYAICSNCSVHYQRRTAGTALYKSKDGKNKWVCNVCGTKVQRVMVNHPIYDGLFSLSGLGKVQVEGVPYCPECDGKPSIRGSFVSSEQLAEKNK